MAKGKDRDDDTDDGGEGKKGLSGKLKLIAIILPVLLVLGGGLYFFVLSGGEADPGTSASASEDGGSAEGADGETDGESTDGESTDGAEATTEAKSTEKPGEIVLVESVTINLAGGHYLKVGLAMQATADAGEEVAPGKAADALIAQFSGKTVDELATEEGRNAAKKALLKTIKLRYEKKVYEIYYTTFVMN